MSRSGRFARLALTLWPAPVVLAAAAFLAVVVSGQANAAPPDCASAASTAVRLVMSMPLPSSTIRVSGTPTFTVGGIVGQNTPDVPTVEVFIDGKPVGEATVQNRGAGAEAGYGQWTVEAPATAGNHSVTACARGRDGAVTGVTATDVTIEVSGAAAVDTADRDGANAPASTTSGSPDTAGWSLPPGAGSMILAVALFGAVVVASLVVWAMILRFLLRRKRRLVLAVSAVVAFVALTSTGLSPFTWPDVWSFVSGNTIVQLLVAFLGLGLVVMLWLFLGPSGNGLAHREQEQQRVQWFYDNHPDHRR